MTLDSKLPAVALFDGNNPPAMAFLRSLGRRSVPVHVYSNRPWHVARFSRYTTARHESPYIEEKDVFLPWLRERVSSGEIQRIVPTSDLMAYCIAELRSLFAPEVQRAIPLPEETLTCLLKHRLHEACAALGHPPPPTWSPASREEALALADRLPYPVIIKPKSHIGIGRAVRGQIIGTAEEFRLNYGAYEPGQKSLSPMQRFPELRWPLVQQFLPGSRDAVYSVSGFKDDDGRLLCHSAAVKREQWPPTMGVGVRFDSCTDSRVIETGLKVVDKILSRGPFEIELLYDPPSDRYLVIDLNARGFGQMRLDFVRGNDLPWLWYQRTLPGTQLAVSPPAKTNIYWRHEVPYHLGQWAMILRGPNRWPRLRRYLATLFKPHTGAVNDWSDPLPNFVFMLRMLRHPGSLVRPYFRFRQSERPDSIGPMEVD